MLRPRKVNQRVVPGEESATHVNLDPVVTAADSGLHPNNNANWLSAIQINAPPERDPFRNVNFPSPLPS